MIPTFLAVATAAAAKAVTAAPVKIDPSLLQQLQNFNPSRSPLAQKVPWLTHGFAGIFVVSAVLMIVMLAIQTTKQEGLSGTLGGRVESAYKGRMGGDAQIARLTGIVAVSFVIFATVLSLSGI